MPQFERCWAWAWWQKQTCQYFSKINGSYYCIGPAFLGTMFWILLWCKHKSFYVKCRDSSESRKICVRYSPLLSLLTLLSFQPDWRSTVTKCSVKRRKSSDYDKIRWKTVCFVDLPMIVTKYFAPSFGNHILSPTDVTLYYMLAVHCIMLRGYLKYLGSGELSSTTWKTKIAFCNLVQLQTCSDLSATHAHHIVVVEMFRPSMPLARPVMQATSPCLPRVKVFNI